MTPHDMPPWRSLSVCELYYLHFATTSLEDYICCTRLHALGGMR